MWPTALRDLIRYAICPIVGLGFLVHEILIVPTPRPVALLTGFALLGYTIDEALRLLSGSRGLPPAGPPSWPPSSSPSIPPRPSSPPERSPGGSPPAGIERSADAADA